MPTMEPTRLGAQHSLTSVISKIWHNGADPSLSTTCTDKCHLKDLTSVTSMVRYYADRDRCVFTKTIANWQNKRYDNCESSHNLCKQHGNAFVTAQELD